MFEIGDEVEFVNTDLSFSLWTSAELPTVGTRALVVHSTFVDGEQLIIVNTGPQIWWRASRFKRVEQEPEKPVTPWWENNL